MDTGFDRTVSGFPVRDGDRAVRCRIGAFHPFQRTKMRIDPDLLESWFDRFDAKHMGTQPGGRSGGPTVAETVTQTDIAVGTAVGMDVVLPFRNDLVNPAGTGDLGIIEIIFIASS